MTITSTAGSALIVGTAAWARASVQGNVTDGRLAIYTQREAADGTNVHASIHDTANVTAGSVTITFAPSGASNDTDIAVHEVAGIVTSSIFDVGNKNLNNTATSPYDPGSITTTQANDYLFAVYTSAGMSGTPSVDSSFNIRQQILTTANIPIVTADRIVSATGTFVPKLTANVFEWAACIASYKAAAVVAAAAPKSVVLSQAVQRASTW